MLILQISGGVLVKIVIIQFFIFIDGVVMHLSQCLYISISVTMMCLLKAAWSEFLAITVLYLMIFHTNHNLKRL